MAVSRALRADVGWGLPWSSLILCAQGLVPHYSMADECFLERVENRRRLRSSLGLRHLDDDLGEAQSLVETFCEAMTPSRREREAGDPSEAVPRFSLDDESLMERLESGRRRSSLSPRYQFTAQDAAEAAEEAAALAGVASEEASETAEQSPRSFLEALTEEVKETSVAAMERVLAPFLELGQDMGEAVCEAGQSLAAWLSWRPQTSAA